MRFDTIAARALNATRATHKPTYVGLRQLLRAADNSRAAFAAFLGRRCVTRKEWRYFSYQVFKDVGRDGKHEYRNCIIGSPLTALAEAHVLGLMETEPAFRVHDCAFSSIWPAEMSGRNFEFFIDGYERRNRLVRELLTDTPGSVAVIHDIRRFYPSVNKARLRDRVVRRVGTVQNRESRRAIERFLLSLLDMESPKYSGIPIGAEIGHALSHLALESVDHAMAEQFGRGYLRYVDDIIIVCPSGEVEKASNLLRQTLADEGLSLHPDKQDEVGANEWAQHCVSFAREQGTRSFETLIEEITHYLICNPDDGEDLQRKLVAAGFSIPVLRLQSLSRSKRYREHLRSRWSLFTRFWNWLFVDSAESIESILESATAVRDDLRRGSELLRQNGPPTTSMRRRWYVQRCRYIFNRLIYLSPASEYRSLLSALPEIDDLVEIRTALDALVREDATTILRYPGRVASTFCELWHLHHGKHLPRIAWPTSPGRPEAESAATLALYLGAKPNGAFLSALDQPLPGGRLLLDLCSGGDADSNRIDPMSYLDEMNELFRGVSQDDLHALALSRFDELEDVGLEGLLLGGSGYPMRFEIAVSG